MKYNNETRGLKLDKLEFLVEEIRNRSRKKNLVVRRLIDKIVGFVTIRSVWI